MKNILVLAGAFILCHSAISQTGFSNSGNMRIHAGSNLRVSGNIINNSGSQLVNNGTIYAAGHIQNNEAGMNAGSGSLVLNGTVTQNITGSSPLVVNNLTTSNSTGVSIANNISINGIHTFTSGVITTSASPNYVIYENTSSHTGAGDSRHVNGWVRKNGTGNFVFPVGNGTILRTIGINDLSSNSAFVAKYSATTPNTWNLLGPLVSLDMAEYWQLDQVSGGTAKVSMNWNHAKVAFPNWLLSEVRVAGYVAGMWTDQGGSATGATTSTGAITSSQLSTFGNFTFASTSVILPVNLLHFDAIRSNSKTNISWKTANENSVDRFEVERSDNGSSFYKIAQEAARNSGAIEFYTAMDNTPIVHEAFYRLRSVDQDGAIKLSRTVKVVEENISAGFRLLANPVVNTLNLRSIAVNGPVDFTIFSASGNSMQKGSISVQADVNFQLPLKGYFAPGAYSIRFVNGGTTRIIRFIVQ